MNLECNLDDLRFRGLTYCNSTAMQIIVNDRLIFGSLFLPRYEQQNLTTPLKKHKKLETWLSSGNM
jgi:hypothetical protein